MLTVAQLGVRVTADTIGAQTQLRNMSAQAKETSGSFKAFLGQTLSMAAGQAVFMAWSLAIGEVSRAIHGAVDTTLAWDDATAQLNAVLKSTHDVSGMTAKQLEDFAVAASKSTKFTDDQVLSAENVLLTFTKLGKDTFPTATGAIMDMATALHQDLQSAVIQVGKALQDPTGVTALRRMGVNFSKEFMKGLQEEFNRGDIQGYQAAIIKELQTEFGGSAAAAGGTLSGQLAITQHKFQDMAQTVGEQVLPTFIRLLDRLEPVIADIGRHLPDAIDAAKAGWKALSPLLDEGKQLLGDVASTVGDVGQSFLTGFGPDKQTQVKNLNQLVQNGKDYLHALKQQWDDMKPTLDNVAQGLGAIVQKLNDLASWVHQHKDVIETLKFTTGLSLTPIKLVANIIGGAAADLNGGNVNLGDVWKNSVPSLPQYAGGGTMARDGLALVGERGPELVRLPGGARVYPYGAAPALGGGSTTTHIYNISGPDPRLVVDELQRRQRRAKAVNRA